MTTTVKEFNRLTEILDFRTILLVMSKRTQKYIYHSDGVDEEISDEDLPAMFNDLEIKYDEGVAYKTVRLADIRDIKNYISLELKDTVPD